MSLSRRAFLRAAALATGAGASQLWVPLSREALAFQRGVVVDPSGTTLERTIQPVGDGPYRRLAFGPPWPIVVRDELGSPEPGREGRRVALTAFLHLTDFQIADAQSPARVEFLDRYSNEPTSDIPFESAQRPQEALVAHTVEALLQRSNAIADGPVTGRTFDFTICTGDNIDNRQENELRWFIQLMDGIEVAPNSGDPDRFEGVQTFDEPEYYDPHYWHPDPVEDPRAPDQYKRFHGFPDYPGLLDAAIRAIAASGIATPWYTCWGNHDAQVQGNEQPNPVYEAIAVGDRKILAPPPGWAPGDFWLALTRGDPAAVAAVNLAPSRPVTPDPERSFLTPRQYIEEHLESPTLPRGHGFTGDNLHPVRLYYTFTLAEGVDGVVLDTTSDRTDRGSIGLTQLRWLESELAARHSRYFDADGREVRTGNDDRLVVLFSHHRAASMQPLQGPNEQGEVEPRFGGDAVEELVHRFPNVVAWLNGHSHVNRIDPRPDPAGRTSGYWDITTAAQIDPPQQARTIEIVDNRDGTLSIFTVVIDHAAPPETDPADLSVLGIAAISRELAYNDFQRVVDAATGRPNDRNTELLVTAPFDLATSPPQRRAQDSRGSSLPATGGEIGTLALGAALTGAVGLRRRGQPRSR